MRGLGRKALVLGPGASLLMVMASCGGGGTTTTTASQTAAVFITSPATSQVVPVNGTLGITATVSGIPNTGVTWAVNGAGNGNSTFGTISDSGLSGTYNAPATVPNPATFNITATSEADRTKSASVRVTITGAAAAVVSITSPSNPAAVIVGGTMPITAAVTGTGNTAVTWTVTGALAGSVTHGNSTIGTIPGTSPTATYTAPAAIPGGNNPVTITATSQADNTKSASLTVTINPSTTAPNAVSVSGGEATGINLSLASNSSLTLGLADVGACVIGQGSAGCSASVTGIQVSRSGAATADCLNATCTVWLLGQGLTDAAGDTLTSGLSVAVTHGSTADVTVNSVAPFAYCSAASQTSPCGFTAITFQIQAAGAAQGNRDIVVALGDGETQAYVGAIQIVN